MSPGPGDRGRRRLGARGEDAAAAWYEARGHEILDRNWRGEGGEIDLVVAAGSVVVFCEVKTRRSDAFGAPAEAVTLVKQARIRRLAAQWLRATRVTAGAVRFDVAAVRAIRGYAPQVDVLESAF